MVAQYILLQSWSKFSFNAAVQYSRQNVDTQAVSSNALVFKQSLTKTVEKWQQCYNL